RRCRAAARRSDHRLKRRPPVTGTCPAYAPRCGPSPYRAAHLGRLTVDRGAGGSEEVSGLDGVQLARTEHTAGHPLDRVDERRDGADRAERVDAAAPAALRVAPVIRVLTEDDLVVQAERPQQVGSDHVRYRAAGDPRDELAELLAAIRAARSGRTEPTPGHAHRTGGGVAIR